MSMKNISFGEFQKIDIRIVKVLECKAVPDSQALLELKVDAGEDHPRKIIAGIKPWYMPEDLVDQFVTVIVNLPMNSIESEGTLIAIDAGNFPILLKPDEKYKDRLKPGMSLK